jgi:PAS domain S-box-containing protein
MRTRRTLHHPLVRAAMQRDRLYRLLQRTPDPAFALTAQGEVWAWNTVVEQLTGISADDALHQSFATLVEPRGPLGHAVDLEYCQRAIREGGVPSFDMQVRARDGRHLWLNVSVLVFEALRASPAVVVHLAHDITASRRRRDVYERLVQAARDIVQFVDEEPHLVPVSPLTEQEQRILGRSPRDSGRRRWRDRSASPRRRCATICTT